MKKILQNLKKIFQIIGLISLTCFSFFMTEKTALVVSDMDEIMIEIKANYKNYHTDGVDAIVDGNTIIPVLILLFLIYSFKSISSP